MPLSCIAGCRSNYRKNSTANKRGESSFWINKQDRFLDFPGGKKFEWQDEYFAVSVSESMVDIVRNYIKNQEEHHKHKTFQQEYDEFITKYKFQKFKD